jgi:hypothetical protein
MTGVFILEGGENAIAKSKERSLTENDLFQILAKNNLQLHDAIVKLEQERENGCHVNIEEVARNVGIESGEGLVLIKLIRYLRGEIELDDVA